MNVVWDASWIFPLRIYIVHTEAQSIETVQRITASESQEWHSEVMDSGQCTNYRIFKNSLQF